MKRIIAGPNAVEEAIKANTNIDVLYIQSSLSQKTAAKLYRLASNQNIPTQSVSKQHLNNLASDIHHQGVVAVTGQYPYVGLDDVIAPLERAERSILLLLDQIQDPGNLGAIVRSAYSLGANAAIITKNRSAQMTSAAVRASAGASELLPIARATNLVSTINALKSAGYQIYGAALEGTQELHNICWPAKIALIMGNEGKGLRQLTRENCDTLLKIPMANEFESLNVSASAAILLYEIFRFTRLTNG